MQLAPRTPGAPRFTGIGIVVLVHAVIVWALINGLMRGPISTPKPAQATVIPDKERPLPPPPPIEIPKPSFKDPVPIFFDAPTVVIDTAPPPAIHATPSDSPLTPSLNGSGRAGVAEPATVAASGKQVGLANPAMVCTKMGKPEVPAVNWSGEAVLKAIATVRGGRVIGADIQVLSGSLDGKSRRALQAAITNALQDTYECPGDHQFEQEFQFRID